jgi:hypothetical protein
MAPTIDKSGRFTVIIFTKDHPPPHVHVRTSEGELRVYLREAIAERTWGRMTGVDERNAIALVKRMTAFYRAEWKRIDPKTD